MPKLNVIISGAAGRDYDNFLVYFKNNPLFNVVCFTATQIPGIENRKFPKELAGKLYKKDIPIYPEKDLPKLIKKYKIDYVYLCYSDLSHQYVMSFASKVLKEGANFALLGTKDTWIKPKKKVISVCAVRTGSGKSQTTRKIASILKNKRLKVVGIRHPMPYGDLIKQEVQRFEKYEDLEKQKCTIEEREEYEPWIKNGFVIYAGVDYRKILERAEKESDVILWDGGNNDWEFYKPYLKFVVVDPHRAGHELTYYPGFVNFLLADVIIINKIDSALKQDIKIIEDNIKKYNPKAEVIKAKSEVTVDNPKLIKNRKVLIVEDGPTITHGEMAFGAGTVAAKKFGAKEIIDVRKYAIGSIKETFKKYPHLGKELPAMGYSKKQINDLQNTINSAVCDVVINGSPIHLEKLIKSNKPIVNVKYELKEVGHPDLKDILNKFLRK